LLVASNPLNAKTGPFSISRRFFVSQGARNILTKSWGISYFRLPEKSKPLDKQSAANQCA
jgi:hypothetical protein